MAAETVATEHRGAAKAAKQAEHMPGTCDYGELLRRLSARSGHANMNARIIDHACSSPSCVSHRIANNMTAAGWRTRAELCCDQPMDACGYTAADANVRLRDAALSKLNGWMQSSLPDYSGLEGVVRGESILHKHFGDRILDSDDVNMRVRHYSHLA